jgi:adenylate cyclase
MVRWLPAAAVTIVPRRAAWFSASSNPRSLLGDGRATPMLKLMTRAPASTHSAIASAVSSGVALGISALSDPVSTKTGLTRSVQPGQIAGALDPRRAARMPATKVPWAIATPLDPVVPAVETALRLNPRDPSVWTFQAGRALALFCLDRLDEAADWAQRSARSVPTGLWSHGIEAAVLAQLGREREAAAALAQVYRLKPDFSADFVLEVFPFQLAGHRDRFLDGLRKAGLPE